MAKKAPDKTKKPKRSGKQTILVICAHNDDNIIGAGGTLVKYSREGMKIVTVICSYGESSHIHLKRKVIVEARVKESQKANEIMGGGPLMYLGLKEGKFREEFEQKSIKKKIKDLIAEMKPSKIFTHSFDDPHPDHREVHNFVLDLSKELNLEVDIYSFDVWNLFKVSSNVPKLVVDVSDTFATKIKAFKVHETQKMAMISLMWKVYMKDRIHGIKNHCRYAEVFYKMN